MEAVLSEYLRFFVVPVNTRARRGAFLLSYFCVWGAGGGLPAEGTAGPESLQRQRRCRGLSRASGKSCRAARCSWVPAGRGDTPRTRRLCFGAR